ncbi:MAG: phenylalanine--tRNA ligase subunit beta, partial [Crocinitomicaceae bacterium]
MKVSYNWLKDYVKTSLSPEELSKVLTDTGLEVDGIEKIENIKGGLEGVFVGEVLSCEKHPDADKLKVTTVTVGGEPLQIVCGAPNVATGQKVICATVGSVLYPNPEEPFKIKASKIRGVESLGMLCAEDELGMGTSHDGIIVLDKDAKVGTPAAVFFELEEDYQIEIGLTPNRADAMGHIGVARDVIAHQNVHQNTQLTLDFPEVEDIIASNQDVKVSVSVEEPELCPKYIGVSLQSVEVKPSPNWMQKRLRAVGLSPINAVVDCTNYVMRELGTPLHAFDADKLGSKIVVKKAVTGDKFTTLDGVERTLHEDDLMITNSSKNLAIAGVFGGLESGISDETKNIFIESAYFNPISVRKTAKRHALNTDASFRYERGVDPTMTEYALKRVVSLIQTICGGTVSMDVASIVSEKFENKIVDFDVNRCNQIIGLEIPTEKVKEILSNLDIQVIEENGTQWKLAVPPYRVDVTREIDVIEEVLRIFGFNNVPLPEKLNSTITLRTKPDADKIQRSVAEFLVGLGYSEMMNNSLTSSAYIQKFGNEVFGVKNNIEMLNPLSNELDVMRQTLIFSTLESIAYNQNRQNSDLKLFEFGKVYRKEDENYLENKRLVFGLSGKRQAEQWNSVNDKVSFYSIKGLVTALFIRLGLDGFLSENALENSLLEDGVSLFVLKKKVGEMGWVSDTTKKHFGIKQPVFIADLDWDALLDQLKLVKVLYKELPKTFEVRRDFSLLLDEQVRFSEIEKLALGVDKKILKKIGLFDVYEGKNLDEGKKSYAVSFH